MKKYLAAVVLSLLVIILSPVISFAKDKGDLGIFETNGVVYSEKTPEQILSWAKTNIKPFLKDYMSVNDDSFIHSYALGHPINLKEYGGPNRIYDFPVLRDGNIIAIYTIYDDNGHYYTQLENNMMASQLQTLYENDMLCGVRLLSNSDGLFAITDEEIVPLTSESSQNIESTDVVDNSAVSKRLSPIDIYDPIVDDIFDSDDYDDDSEQPIITSLRDSDQKTINVHTVPQTLEGTFGGTSRNWCAAATAAAFINYKKGTGLTAKQVIMEVYGLPVDEGLTNSQVISVANKHRLSPRSGDPLSFSSVKTQINGDKPIFMKMQRTENGTKKYHAVGLIGYSSTSYTIINPWYAYRTYISKQNNGSNVKLVDGSRTYTWESSVYNWS